jgi:hypothetical protein
VAVKRVPLKRKSKKRTARERSEAFQALCIRTAAMRVTFKREVTRRGCVMCANEQLGDDVKRGYAIQLAKLDAHHVIAKRHLKEEGLDEFSPLMWDPLNGVCLCAYHHQRHEHAVQRLPRRLVPIAAVRWAIAIGLEWRLDREYPPDSEQPCDSCGTAEAKWTGMSWLCADCEAEFRE